MMPNILWVDDEIDMLKGHLLFLEGKGYAITTCNNGADALDLVQETQETWVIRAPVTDRISLVEWVG